MKQGMRAYTYHTSCVNSRGDWIDNMVDQAEVVTLQTVRKHCADVRFWEQTLKYDVGNERGGLRLKDDWHVTYHKSQYRGLPCYYIQHSGIEHIWVKGKL